MSAINIHFVLLLLIFKMSVICLIRLYSEGEGISHKKFSENFHSENFFGGDGGRSITKNIFRRDLIQPAKIFIIQLCWRYDAVYVWDILKRCCMKNRNHFTNITFNILNIFYSWDARRQNSLANFQFNLLHSWLWSIIWNYALANSNSKDIKNSSFTFYSNLKRGEKYEKMKSTRDLLTTFLSFSTF